MTNSAATSVAGEAAAEPQQTEHAPPAKVGRLGALQSKNFRLLWIGMVSSNAGTWMQMTADGWLVTDLAKNNASVILGLISFAFAVPMFALTMIGGAVADRFPRKRMLWIVQFGYLGIAVVLAIVTLGGWIQVWMLVAYSFFNGLVLAFDSPARNSLLPDLVDREHLAGAVSLNSAAYSGAALVGPAIAGALIPLIGVGGVYNAISVVAVLWALKAMVGVPEHVANKSAEQQRIWSSLKEGMKFAFASPIVLGVLLVSVVSGIFVRSYSPLLVIFARDEFHVGSFPFGVMVAAPGIGTLIAAYQLASRADTGRRGRKLWIAVSGMAISLALFAVMPWFLATLPFLVLAGYFATTTAATMATIVQLQAPPFLRGRVMGIYLVTIIAVPSVGTLISGWVADFIGVRATVSGAAVIMLAVGVAIFMRRNELREVD